MIDCGDTNTCAIPMGIQYFILAVAMLLFILRCSIRKDPYDRW